MNRSPIIHPRLIQSLVNVGYFPFSARIEQRIGTRQASGGFAPGDWAAVPGLEDVPAMVGPPSLISATQAGSEARGAIIEELDKVQCNLAGFYPAVTAAMRVVLDDGRILGILAAVQDSQTTWTLLSCRLLNPVAEPGI